MNSREEVRRVLSSGSFSQKAVNTLKKGQTTMNTDMFLPKKIKVGFQKREDTYNGQLAYATYVDEQGFVKKESSFERWRDYQIDTEMFDNEPMTGFVMNRRVGGYRTKWGFRDSYIRVYDPRGFEIEISVDNQLFILEHMNSIIGKGFDGELIYAWADDQLILLPTNSDEYQEIKKKSEIRHERTFVKAKELEVGHSYFVTMGYDINSMVFMGEFEEYEYKTDIVKSLSKYPEEFASSPKTKKRLYFARRQGENEYDYFNKEKGYDFEIITLSTATKKKFGIDKEEINKDLSLMQEQLEKDRRYSPVDVTKNKKVLIPFEDFEKEFSREYITFIADNGKEYAYGKNNDGKLTLNTFKRNSYHYEKEDVTEYEGFLSNFNTLREVYDILKPQMTEVYLENGNLYSVKWMTWS